MANAGIPRSEIFLTTKIWPSDYGMSAFVAATEQSLRELRSDYIDLLLLHWPPNDGNLEAPLDGLRAVIAKGWVRNGGVSNFPIGLLEQALRLAGDAIAGHQIPCHVGAVQRDVIRATRERGIALTAYSPLARGALRDDRRLAAIGKRHGMTAAQVALRWLTQQGIAVIPKTRSKERLSENLAAQDFTLDEADIEVLDNL